MLQGGTVLNFCVIVLFSGNSFYNPYLAIEENTKN